jgi:hypothetical protein
MLQMQVIGVACLFFVVFLGLVVVAIKLTERENNKN